MTIQLLPEDVRNQIAAGEVVERPASVVKELVENALDGGAENIQIYIENGGLKLIKVVDDGEGIPKEDLRKAILRHATSKIQKIDDLFHIGSFGFRGEALAAISSVSDFEIISRIKDIDEAYSLTVDAGKNEKIEKKSGNVGIIVSVKNLFYSTPARLQYLKTSATEYRKIMREVYSFAIQNNEISFQVYKDSKLVLDLVAVTEKKQRILQILKKKSEQMLDFNSESGSLKVSGFTSIPGEGLSHKNQQYIFVNHRRIEDYRIAYAVREAYIQSCGMEHHLYPYFVIFLEIDPILVDVNVHPRKLEVKFAEPSEIFSVVKFAVIQGLEKFSGGEGALISPPPAKLGTPLKLRGESSGKNYLYSGNSRINFSERKKLECFNRKISQPSFLERNLSLEKSPKPPLSSGLYGNNNFNISPPPAKLGTPLKLRGDEAENFLDLKEGDLKLIGQVANKYLMAETEKGIYFFDQHALHERQRFEIFWQEYKSKKINSQKLLIPEILKFDESQIIKFSENFKILKKIGFEINFPEDDALEVLEIPQVLVNENLEKVFGLLLDFLENDKIGEHALDRVMRKILEYKSCRGAVMFGDRLEREEMEKLLKDFHKTDWKLLCPHGRPNHFFMPFEVLDKKFHR